MNLQPLFQAQKKLDDHIEKNKGLEGQNLLDKKILALQVELGELANEWRGFKYWSENQEPSKVIREECENCAGTGISAESYPLKNCKSCKGSGTNKVNPLLQEYADVFHFILSISNDLNFDYDDWVFVPFKKEDIIQQFMELSYGVLDVFEHESSYCMPDLIRHFLGLGEMLGFTWEEIEQAYFKKNKENHRRQENGY